MSSSRGSRRGGRYRLAPIMALAGYEVPAIHGPELTGRRLRYLRSQLEKRAGSYAALTRCTKAKWTNVLKHNLHDCYGMRSVDRAAAAASSVRLPRPMARGTAGGT